METLDFTSSNYLGYRHGHAALPPWQELTTGRPAVLAEPRAARWLAGELARRSGRQAAVLAASTLHAFVDVWSALAAEPSAALVDEAAYPIGRLALRAGPLGDKATTVHHFDARAVVAAIRALPEGTRPVLLVDGLCPGCGRLAPLPGLLDALRPRRGLLLVDDTQALGLAGSTPRPDAPYGEGGGGTAARLQVPGSAPLVVVASAAKAFGAPLAVVAGPAAVVARVRRRGPARMHGSGPSAAALAALAAALADDDVEGAARRRRLAGLVVRLRRLLAEAGCRPSGGGPWPLQWVPLQPGTAGPAQRALLRCGVRAVAVGGRCRPGTGLALLLTAEHTPAELRRAADALSAVLVSRELT